MSGIPISVSSGLNNTIFGEIQGPLSLLIEQRYERFQNSEFTLWDKIFKEYKLQTHTGTIGEVGAIGLFEDVGENGAYPISDIKDGFLKHLMAEEWKNSFGISQTAMEDKMDQVLKDGSKQLVDAFYRTKNAFFWGLLAAALNGSDYVTKKKNKISIKAKDGVNLFSQSHKMANASGSICNAFSNAFSKTALGTVAEKMQNMKDDNGEIIGLTPDTIIIPNTEKAKDDVFGVVGAHNDPDTAAGNKYNYQFGNWTVIAVPWLAELATADSYPWIIMDSQYNEDGHGAIDVERIPLNITSELASNDVNLWKVRGRFSGAFQEFRAFAAGGLSYGAQI